MFSFDFVESLEFVWYVQGHCWFVFFFKKILNPYLTYGSLLIVMSVALPFPVIISKEGKWFVASCPLLDIATQGKSEDEVKENMVDLINDYLCDPDTAKVSVEGTN